ncbi:hypothetical protein TraAM80_05763 [Trypanosoma rangeli]|uniref:Uncharacterized protein n=1 Tax=Trypanosoma rangeli TaxID=5698 RepID=A0A422ND24_TRYRA|nr:uncharacterized protein TraAM80_05763 [Trypanosoma rangeli]RNF03400.1 hypothetical protein TraAM80_05763 [Trypanosoma rangeli]|eukprot:RNF03400.1 hypothetical protein TraAM80_05763 [Trypanosoma rangeli]
MLVKVRANVSARHVGGTTRQSAASDGVHSTMAPARCVVQNSHHTTSSPLLFSAASKHSVTASTALRGGGGCNSGALFGHRGRRLLGLWPLPLDKDPFIPQTRPVRLGECVG